MNMRLLLLAIIAVPISCLSRLRVGRLFAPTVAPKVLAILGCVAANACHAQVSSDGQFRWRVGKPLLSVESARLPATRHAWLAVKDPSIVRFDGEWHLFCTLRKNKQGAGRIRIGYLSFRDWSDLDRETWDILHLTMGYHGAPQIFWYELHNKWYLIYQAEDQTRGLRYGPCFSTNDDITRPDQWTLPKPLYVVPEGTKAGLDYWIICDDTKAHLFFTSLNGQMWRSETSREDFPDSGWSRPQVCLRADIFEASHTYALAGEERFLTIVEAQKNRRRYFKGFVADRLDGEWRPLTATKSKPFVAPSNVVNQSESWASSYSHGEFLRLGHDERMFIDPDNLRLLFQGANDEEYRRDYGEIPWKLGLLQSISARKSVKPITPSN